MVTLRKPTVTRRAFLKGLSATPFVFSASHGTANAQVVEVDPIPRPSMLESGDLVWPKRPLAIVLYDSSNEGNRDSIKKQWEKERDDFVRLVRAKPGASPNVRQLATDLEALTFEEFYLRYHASISPSEIQKFGAFDDVFSVGHVGLIEITPAGEKYVIEAVLGSTKRVQRINYDEWLKGRTGSWVWLGRLRDQSSSTREKVVQQAKTYLDRPYNFWNFDLGDESDFYCSKLVWISVAKALNVFLDDDKNFERTFWYSPKQAWNSPYIVQLNKPREFSY